MIDLNMFEVVLNMTHVSLYESKFAKLTHFLNLTKLVIIKGMSMFHNEFEFNLELWFDLV